MSARQLGGPTTLFAALAVALILTSCAGAGVVRSDPDDSAQAREYEGITDADACATAMDRTRSDPIASRVPSTIRLLSWNIQKNKRSELQSDMHRLAEGADLILLQEATKNFAVGAQLKEGYYDSFAPGYRSSKADTGVMTVSRAAPLTQCSFRYSEPWLRTSKATNVTEYAVADRDQTLLVINMHLVNFALGVSDLRKQLDEAVLVIERHAGPVIVSGDFNTWSRTRGRAVIDALTSLDLRPISFSTDLRRRVFGNALDHVYLRGGGVVASTSYRVESSDHNPMSVVLKLWDDASPGAKRDIEPH